MAAAALAVVAGPAAAVHRLPRRPPMSLTPAEALATLADLGADGTVNLAGGLFLGLHQTAVGNEILNRREARNVVDFIQKHQGQNLADARNRIQQMKCIRIVQLGMTQDFQLDLVQQTIVEINPFQVKGDVGSLLTKCPSPVVAPGFYLFLSWRSCRYRSSYDKRFKGPCLGCGNVRLKLCIWAPGRPRLGLRDPKEKVPRSCRSFCPMVLRCRIRPISKCLPSLLSLLKRESTSRTGSLRG